LVSHRGKKGGYSLAHDPKDISVAEMIRVLEGPVVLTECSSAHIPTLCEMESKCPVRSNWQVINEVVFQALKDFSLAQMLDRPHCESLPGTKSFAEPTLLELVKS
jgi:Rrf2 family protein